MHAPETSVDHWLFLFGPFLVRQVHAALLRRSEEELEEARREAARGCRQADVQRGELLRLQDELREEEEKVMSAAREMRSLSTYTGQLSQELEELRGKRQATGSNQSTNPSVTHYIPSVQVNHVHTGEDIYCTHIHVFIRQLNNYFLNQPT